MNQRLIENLHVLIWLLKDISWAMEFKLLGSLMIIPAIIAAVWISYLTQNQMEFWVNLAVFFWILANSTWMLIEFFHFGNVYYCLPFFILGFLSFLYYLFLFVKSRNRGRYLS